MIDEYTHTERERERGVRGRLFGNGFYTNALLSFVIVVAD